MNDFNSYIPSTVIFDIDELREMSVSSPEFKEILIRLYQHINTMSMSINNKASGIYDTHEYASGKLFYPPTDLTSSSNQSTDYRPGFCKVISFGALPNTASKSVVHELEVLPGWMFTKIAGVACDERNGVFIPLPYSSPTLADNIELSVDDTSVTVTTGADWSMYTRTDIILEYLKQ
jgi:hypothetical protein